MLARHPRYDLALLKIEDDHFLDQIHVHPRDPHNDMALHVIAYQNNQYLRECTHVISNSDIAFTAAGERHIDMFRIRRSFGYGWSGAVVVNYARGHLIGLVSSSSQRQHVDYSSCSRAVHIDDI